jgi:restriction endonuclease S subunit
MRYKLGEIAKIQFGLHSSDIETEGAIKYIQVKNFTELNEFDLDECNYVNLKLNEQNHLLEDDNVLFVGKGLRNFAWTYRKELGGAVASSIFFVLKVNSNIILPDYLTTLLNSTKYQNLFQQLGAGSSIPSIRKSELEAIIIDIPSIELQTKIVTLKKNHTEDVSLSKQIISEKEKLFNGIINKLINA